MEQTTKQESAGYVEFNQYNGGHLVGSYPEKMTTKDAKGQDVTYHLMKLSYNYGSKESPILGDFFMEGCEMTSNSGINTRPGLGGKLEHSIMVRFNVLKEEQAIYVSKIVDLHKRCCGIVAGYKGFISKPKFNPEEPGDGFKCPIYFPYNKETGDLIQGQAPSTFIKLFSRGKPPYGDSTLFTDLEGRSLDWDLLRGVDMTFVPLLHIKRIYSGSGSISIQIEMVSAIVTSITPRNSVSMQTKTMQRLRETDPSRADSLKAQIAKLTTMRQEKLCSNSETKEENSDSESNSDVSQSDFVTTNTFTQMANSENNNMGLSMKDFLNQDQPKFNIPTF